MAQGNVTKCLGLITQYNALSITDGALTQADNAVIRRENIVENRRGYASYGVLANEPTQLMTFSQRVLALNGTTISYDNGSGTFSDYTGSFSAPSTQKMRFQEALSNCYVTTSTGVQVLMDVTAPVTGVTGTTTSGTNLVTSVSDVTNAIPGKGISGTGIPANTYVASVSGTTVTISANASASATINNIAFTSRPRLVGAPRSLGPNYTLTGSTGFLADDHQCAYRSVIQRTDQNKNVLFGYPSERLWVDNEAGGARNVIITQYLPSAAVAGDVVQFYRTPSIANDSPVTDISGDEEKLTYQYALLQADILLGYITFTDVTIDDLLGATIYTASSQQGFKQANAGPPLCRDIALYKANTMFFANTKTKEGLYISLVSASKLGTQSVGAVTDTSTSVTLSAVNANIVIGMKITDTTTPGNIAPGTTVANIVGTALTLSTPATGSGGTDTLQFVTARTIILAGTTYTFAATGDPATGVIQVYTSGIAANDINNTARSMVQTIDRFATNTTVYAYYVSGALDLPGRIFIEERVVGGSAFTFQVSNAAIQTQFFPEPPVSTATTPATTSSNNIAKNGLYYSKNQEPESVPILNYIPVGPANTNIQRIAALRDSLIIIKDEGIYRLTGNTPEQYIVTPLDLTAFCKAPDSVGVLSNQVFMLSNQGVVSISDTGVQVVSHEIEPNILPLLTYSLVANLTYGIPYESERSYNMSTITNSSDTVPNQTYVYNTFTKAWTRWTFAFTSGIVESSTDKLYFTKTLQNIVYRERKQFNNNDYRDPEFSITIVSISGDTVVFTLSSATPVAGWAITQGGTTIIISELNQTATTWTATMASTPPASWTTGAATIYPGIAMTVEWDAYSAGQPGFMKQGREFKILTDNITGNDSVSTLYATFRTDLDNTKTSEQISSNSSGWGSPWGNFPWGGVSENFSYPTWVPQRQSYFRILNPGLMHNNAGEKISCAGWSLTFEGISERVSK